ncbi:hypothetical protein CTAYLR_001709 [Chrysophaeum taylorii]|uniref:Fe2OG dioxygenase domain-containing protein n=1 Tax=Chrysophaeum taylorii TaxID=2483200 RepID=A0AAD7U5E2_9STRA|nr:hypothetical protein CTAYLR_001709 [Chrysophaeum taylorii]
MISERVIPQYMETMKTFEPRVWKGPRFAARNIARTTWVPSCDLDGVNFGHLVSHSAKPLFDDRELDAVVDECEERASTTGWSTSRHLNYPTTDVSLADLPRTLDWFRNDALPSVVYPFLTDSYGFVLPDPRHLRVVDAFVVKYNATNGQTRLEPHRDGSIVSFNIALNDLRDYEGGGTWFEGIQTAIRSPKGHVLAHASGLLHGGHPITSGVRYILVAFVILRSYPNFATRFYDHVRDR